MNGYLLLCGVDDSDLCQSILGVRDPAGGRRKLIDWFTTVAQVVNFLILVALLRYFLYGRVISVMQQREKHIAERWAEAERQREAAQQELAAAEKQRRQLEERRAELLEAIRREVDAYRQQLMGDVRRQVDQQRQQWLEALAADRDALLRGFQRTVMDQVNTIARRALQSLADVELEQQIVRCFFAQLDALSDAERKAIRQMILEGDGELTVETTFELKPETRRAIEQKLGHLIAQQVGKGSDGKNLAGGLEVDFTQRPDLICGLALRTTSYRIGWSLADYLEDIQRDLQRVLDQELQALGGQRERPEVALVGDGRTSGGEQGS
ncbi:MAG: hypothetical protein D6753_02300 [Planctomycetota bacterium]|nr:MAG: hypothetical protein D6753_02300 [Planctomycetota bacterium]